MSPIWDPQQYDRYRTYRDRPALDLLLRLPGDVEPSVIWDLGCGGGEHAALLKRRHPAAEVHGLDASAEMLEVARARLESVTWIQGDIGAWRPDRPVDLIFSNAALQWLGGHADLFPRLADQLAPGGVLAVQMPQSHAAPWYELLRETLVDSRWRDRLAAVEAVKPLEAPDLYYDWLSATCDEIDIWSATYLHVLTGDDPIIDWMQGTGLRPYLQALTEPSERDAFLQSYRDRVAAAFPPRPTGETLFPFPRLFVVARRR